MKISDFKIGSRLTGAFSLLLVLLVGMLVSAVWQLNRINESKMIMVDAHHKTKLAAAWREGIATNGVRTIAKTESTDTANETALDREMKVVSREVDKVQETLKRLVLSDQGKANLQAVADQRKIYSETRTDLFRYKAEQGITDEFKKRVAETWCRR